MKNEKRIIRERIWRIMEERSIAKFPRPVYGRIPNFKGSERAALRLISNEIFKKARVIFCNPDSPQRLVREEAIRRGKILIMATPRLRKGFLLLQSVPKGREREASTIRGAFKYGRLVMSIDCKVDLEVVGSVAVARNGARLGKGGGFSDLEYAILRGLGVIDESTPIATTVHDVQIVKRVPVFKHDVPVDFIFTPTREIRTQTAYKKPPGVIKDELSDRMIDEIPILRKILKLS